MDVVDFADIIGRRWSEADCAETALEAMRRCGVSVPDRIVWTPDYAAAEGRLVEELRDQSARWESLGGVEGAGRVGDLIVSRSVEGPAPLHLTVVSNVPERLGVTCTVRAGVHVVRIDQIVAVVGAYRWIGGAA